MSTPRNGVQTPLKPLGDRVDTRRVRSTRIAAEDGFTLVEVLVAATILIIGTFAAFQLVDAASRTTSANSARIGGTNLTRELTEFARGADYDELQPTTLETALRKNAAVAGSGSPWRLVRRAVTYTATPSVCTFDDPKDGLAATPPSNACPVASALNTKVDQNPDDFRRVTIRLDWTARGRNGSMTQTALVVNPAGGLGPRITQFDEPVNQDFTTQNSIDCIDVSAR